MSLFSDYLSLSGIFIIIPIVLVYLGVRSVMKSIRRDKLRAEQSAKAAQAEQADRKATGQSKNGGLAG